MIYTGCPKKGGTAGFQYLASSKCHIWFTLSVKASSAEENDTKIIEFGWVILILCPFFELQSFLNFGWFLRPMSVEFSLPLIREFDVAGTITHEKCRLGRFRSVLKCYSLWIKWVLKFLILWSDEINHSNFENATKCLNKSWWYLLKHACFMCTFSMEENKL